MTDLIDAIASRAETYDPIRFLLLLVAAPLVAVGWVSGVAWKALWVVFAWMWAAVIEGYTRGRT